MPAARPTARQDLTVVELDGEAVIYDERTGELHHLNPTATIVFDLCDGTQTIPQMAADIAAAFGMPLAEVEPQVRTVVADLRSAALLKGGRRVAAAALEQAS